ncbi:MAG: hypothetical protein J0I43_02705 [Microbacterium sp.]|uniref:hypothetical protein n=1 Tax=Microbacterium sp. TaxID=51671 RepID=UPI001AC6CAA9|nr:hypothetical protein [Microbacterium sp.]MBN9176267.1 hypothetical protein [Microbacterium sp.]
MPSSADDFDAALERAAADVWDAVRSLHDGARVIVLIDGRSGAGKTTLASLLRERWPGGVQVVALDDIYPGWDGLAAGAETLTSAILDPLSAGRDAHWRRWDWAASAPGAWMTTRADLPLIAEGCGAITAASAARASISVWLESPQDARRTRALARDGEAYRPHWDRWAAQEARHLADDDPRSHATIVVDVP